MPKFSYRAITDIGDNTSGEIEADSVESASSMLAAQGYIPTRVKEERPAMEEMFMTAPEPFAFMCSSSASVISTVAFRFWV